VLHSTPLLAVQGPCFQGAESMEEDDREEYDDDREEMDYEEE